MTCICSIKSLRENGTGLIAFDEQDEQEVWELERNTWTLIRDLFIARLNAKSADGPSISYTGSDLQIASEFQSSDPEAAEWVIVKEWLEKTAPPTSPLEVRKSLWPFTVREVETARNRGKSCEYADALDPDGPLRTGLNLHLEDNKYESNLLRSLFELIRRGQMEKALQLCRSCNQPWRAVSLRGGLYFNDPNVFKSTDASSGQVWDDENAPTGNRNRGIWMMTCFQIANEPLADQHERAIYAALCGNTVHVLPVCRTFEDIAWAYFNSMVISATEKHLSKSIRIRAEEYHEFASPEAEVSSAVDVFDRISKLNNEDIAVASKQILRKLQVAIITDQLDPILAELDALIDRGESVDQRYLRFVVHLILLCRAVGFSLDNTVVDRLISAYVDILIEAGKKDLVAMYAAHLARPLQVAKMAQLLQNMQVDAEERRAILQEAQDYGLDIQGATQSTVDAVFKRYQREILTPAHRWTPLSAAVDSSDQSQIHAIVWLMHVPEQNVEALLQCNALYRRFLINGKWNAAQALRETLIREAPQFGSLVFATQLRHQYGDRYENFVREQMHYFLFLTAVNEHVQWQEDMERFQHANEEQPVHSKARFIQKTTDTVNALEEVLSTSSSLSWLQDDVQSYSTELPDGFDTAQRHVEIQTLRGMYLPWFILTLQSVLAQTIDLIPSNLMRAIKMVKLVAAKDYGLWKEMLTQEHLETFLQRSRELMLLSMEKQGSPFGQKDLHQ